MDHFERELARMMRDAQDHTPFEPKHQSRLRSGVRARRCARAVRKAVGSVLAVAGLTMGLFLLPHERVENRPQAPLPEPVTSPASPRPSTSLTSDVPPSPTGTAGGATTMPAAPPTTGDSATAPSGPTTTEPGAPSPSDSGTLSAPPTP